jgi:hypothetical protein
MLKTEQNFDSGMEVLVATGTFSIHACKSTNTEQLRKGNFD